MFKLILHHTYKMAGEAVDLSPCGNHGSRTGTSYMPNGIAPGTGALYFDGVNDKVVVRYNPSLANLRAIKIESLIYLEELVKRRNIIEGHLSFAFFIHPDGVLWGTFYDPKHLTPPIPGSDPSWPGVNSSAAFAPDGVDHTIPLNQWVKVRFIHDGIATARLYVDDVLVGANYNLRSSVGSVGSLGLTIGQWPDAAQYTFKGRMDEVKLWRYDPDAAAKAFFCRPMKPEQFACWKDYFDRIGNELKGKEGERMIWFIICIMKAQEELVRNMRSHGDKNIEQLEEFTREYLRLRCEGELVSDEMRDLLKRWTEWTKKVVGPDILKKWADRLNDCMMEYKILEEQFKGMAQHLQKCDPEFVKFLEMIRDVWAPLGLWKKPAPESFIGRLIKAILSWFRRIFKKTNERRGMT